MWWKITPWTGYHKVTCKHTVCTAEQYIMWLTRLCQSLIHNRRHCPHQMNNSSPGPQTGLLRSHTCSRTVCTGTSLCRAGLHFDIHISLKSRFLSCSHISPAPKAKNKQVQKSSIQWPILGWQRGTRHLVSTHVHGSTAVHFRLESVTGGRPCISYCPTPASRKAWKVGQVT